MALETTIEHLKELLHQILHDLGKSVRKNGNKAAAQRVRTNTIKFAKLAKVYRKESVAVHKKNSTDKKKGPKKKSSSKKTVAKKRK